VHTLAYPLLHQKPMLSLASSTVFAACATLALVGSAACVAPVDSPVGTTDSSHTELPTMAASYSLTIDSTVVATHEEDGSESILHTRLFALAHTTQNGAEVSFTVQPCRLSLPPAGGFQGTVKDRTIQLAEPVATTARLVVGEDGYELRSDPFAFVLGVEDVAPDEPLPTDGDDPRVVDVDEDDAPGFSIHFAMMRVFSALRAAASLSGRPVSGGDFVGPVELEVEHVIYGDSNWLVDAKELAEEAAEKTTVESEDHRFVLEPLQVEHEASCADVLALL